MSDPNLVARRAAARPVLIVEDDLLRGREMLAEVEDLGLACRLLPTQSLSEPSDPTYTYSMAILRVRSLRPEHLKSAEAIRKLAPSTPLLLICEDKEPGASPWPDCKVVPKKGALKQLRVRVAETLGIGLSDDPGTTLKT
jgi:hypothetical protein